jgi:hypothetical protein
MCENISYNLTFFSNKIFDFYKNILNTMHDQTYLKRLTVTTIKIYFSTVTVQCSLVARPTQLNWAPGAPRSEILPWYN